MKSESEVTQSCLTLSDLMDCSLPGSSVHGIFQARVLERGAIAFSVVTTEYFRSLQLIDLLTDTGLFPCMDGGEFMCDEAVNIRKC